MTIRDPYFFRDFFLFIDMWVDGRQNKVSNLLLFFDKFIMYLYPYSKRSI